MKEQTRHKKVFETKRVMPKHPDKIKIITCKIPVMTDVLTGKKLRELQKLTTRDTSIIKEHLEVIEIKKDELFNKEISMTDAKAHLDSLTLTNRPLKRSNPEGVISVTTS